MGLTSSGGYSSTTFSSSFFSSSAAYYSTNSASTASLSSIFSYISPFSLAIYSSISFSICNFAALASSDGPFAGLNTIGFGSGLGGGGGGVISSASACVANSISGSSKASYTYCLVTGDESVNSINLLSLRGMSG